MSVNYSQYIVSYIPPYAFGNQESVLA